MPPLFSTAYLPPVSYLAAMARHHAVLIEAKETFPKQTYRNRAVILTAGGVRNLSVPLLRHNHSRTDEVGIDYRDRWAVTHLRTIEAAYAASPYYLYYRDDLEALLTQHYDTLLDLNGATTRWLLAKLHIDCTIALTTDWQPPTTPTADDDWRDRFSPKRKEDPTGFKPYCQVFADRLPFHPDLSAIDLLFNLGPEAPEYL